MPDNLNASVDHAEALRPLIPDGMTMPEMALRFILAHPTVSTIIPGMRKLRHVESNIGTSDGDALPPNWSRPCAPTAGIAARPSGRSRDGAGPVRREPHPPAPSPSKWRGGDKHAALLHEACFFFFLPLASAPTIPPART